MDFLGKDLRKQLEAVLASHPCSRFLLQQGNTFKIRKPNVRGVFEVMDTKQLAFLRMRLFNPTGMWLPI